MVLNRNINLLVTWFTLQWRMTQCYLGVHRLWFQWLSCCEPTHNPNTGSGETEGGYAAQVSVLGWRTILLEFKRKTAGQASYKLWPESKRKRQSFLRPGSQLCRLQTDRHPAPAHMQAHTLTYLCILINLLCLPFPSQLLDIRDTVCIDGGWLYKLVHGLREYQDQNQKILDWGLDQESYQVFLVEGIKFIWIICKCHALI